MVHNQDSKLVSFQSLGCLLCWKGPIDSQLSTEIVLLLLWIVIFMLLDGNLSKFFLDGSAKRLL